MKTVRVGIVGVGGMGSSHARLFADGKIKRGELKAVCDISPKALEAWGDDIEKFDNSDALIASGKVDAVIVATPHYGHTTIGKAVLDAGLHLLVEKPISVHKADCERLIASHTNKKQVFAAMFNQRTDPQYKAVKKLIASGDLGEIKRVNWIITNWFRSQRYYDGGGWRATWSGEGGGVLLNQCPHQLDLLQWLCGKPSRVRAFCNIAKYHHIEVEDHADAMLTYPEGGTGYMYCATCEAGPGQMIEVYGENGKLCYRNGQLQFFRFKPGVEEFTRKSTAMWGGPECVEQKLKIKEGPRGHLAIIENFARHIRKGEPLIAPGEEGLRSLELANAVWLSAHTGKKVKLPLSRRAYDDFLREMRRKSTFKKGKVKARRVTDPRHKI